MGFSGGKFANVNFEPFSWYINQENPVAKYGCKTIHTLNVSYLSQFVPYSGRFVPWSWSIRTLALVVLYSVPSRFVPYLLY